MMKQIRIRHFFKALKFLISDGNALSKVKYNVKYKTLLIVKLDAIGDYLLFRNYLEDIRKSKRFSDYHITLCGNIIWKELAETLDKSNVDGFIWVDRKKLTNDQQYRKSILQKIKDQGFEMVFQPTFSREILTGDSIVKASEAIIKIGSTGDDASEISILKNFADDFYTELLDKNSTVVFEFEKNRLIIEEFTGEKIERSKPQIEIDHVKKDTLPYAVLFPGAGEKQKQWPPDHFAAIADELRRVFNFEIKICGSSTDSSLADEIISSCRLAKPVDRCGDTNLIQLINEIAHAAFLFTNDSSALHIAACLNTKTVCVLNGRHYGRFAPYPRSMVQNLSFVFTDEMDDLIAQNEQEAIAKTKYHAIGSIDSISIAKVTKAVTQLLK